MEWAVHCVDEAFDASGRLDRLTFARRVVLKMFRHWQFWLGSSSVLLLTLASWAIVAGTSSVIGVAITARGVKLASIGLGLVLWSAVFLAPLAIAAYRAGRRSGARLVQSPSSDGVV